MRQLWILLGRGNLSKLSSFFAFAFRGTFLLLALQAVVLVFNIAAILLGYSDLGEFALIFGSNIAAVLLAVCLLLMFLYGVQLVIDRFRSRGKREALRWLLTLVFFNIIAVYYWYFQFEVKGRSVTLDLHRQK